MKRYLTRERPQGSSSKISSGFRSQIWRNRNNPLSVICAIFHGEPCVGKCGALNFFPENFPRKFLGHRPSQGDKCPPLGIRPHSTFPINHPKTPVFRTSPSKGYNPSTEPRTALKSPRFGCPLPSDICTTTSTLSPIPPKIPRFSTFS